MAQRLQRLSQIDRPGRARRGAVSSSAAITTGTTSKRRRSPRSRPALPSPGCPRLPSAPKSCAGSSPSASPRSRSRPKRNGAAPASVQRERSQHKGDISYGAFVRSQPPLDGIVTARGDTMCLDGMKHGEHLRRRDPRRASGRPPANRLRETFKTRRRRSRPQAADQLFRHRLCTARAGHRRAAADHGQSRQGQIAAVAGQRAQPRAEHRRRAADDDFSSYEVDEIINRTGSLVWEGEMAITGERNRAVTTAIPLKDMLHEKGPGIYLAVAERTDLMQDDSMPSRRPIGFSSPISAWRLTRAPRGWRSMSARLPTASR